MGYFDALTSGSFKTMPDGQRLFFPWGIFGHGYVIGSEPEYERLRRRAKVFIVAGMAAAIPVVMAAMIPVVIEAAALRDPSSFEEHLWTRALALVVVFSVVYFAVYVAWLRSMLRGLQPSTERLTLRENMVTQSRAHSPVLLWALEICSIGVVFVGVSIFVSIPGSWFTAIIGVFFGSVCATLFAFMLALRWRR